MAPLSRSVKKPSPLSARSRLLPVNSTLPALNCWRVSATRTPLPITSANSMRPCLKPSVAALLML
jgi:hypothetical protein